MDKGRDRGQAVSTKRPGGHEQRRLAEAKREAERQGLEPPPGSRKAIHLIAPANRKTPAKYLAKYRELGTPPKDPTRGLIYAQQAMLVALHEIMNDAHIGSEMKWKLIANLGSKVGMTYAKTLQQGKLDELARGLLPLEDEPDEDNEHVDPEAWDRARRPRKAKPGTVSGPGTGAQAEKDEGVDPGSGGPVGSGSGPIH